MLYSPDEDKEYGDDPGDHEDAGLNGAEHATAANHKPLVQVGKAREWVLKIIQLKKVEDGEEVAMYIATIPKTKVDVFNLTIRCVVWDFILHGFETY